MIYRIRTNKRLRYIKVYAIVKKVGRNDNFMTKFFMKIFSQKKPGEQESATERLR